MWPRRLHYCILHCDCSRQEEARIYPLLLKNLPAISGTERLLVKRKYTPYEIIQLTFEVFTIPLTRARPPPHLLSPLPIPHCLSYQAVVNCI